LKEELGSNQIYFYLSSETAKLTTITSTVSSWRMASSLYPPFCVFHDGFPLFDVFFPQQEHEILVSLVFAASAYPSSIYVQIVLRLRTFSSFLSSLVTKKPLAFWVYPRALSSRPLVPYSP